MPGLCWWRLGGLVAVNFSFSFRVVLLRNTVVYFVFLFLVFVLFLVGRSRVGDGVAVLVEHVRIGLEFVGRDGLLGWFLCWVVRFGDRVSLGGVRGAEDHWLLGGVWGDVVVGILLGHGVQTTSQS